MQELCFWQDKLQNVPICIDLVNNYEQIKKEIIEFVSNPENLNDYPKYEVSMNNRSYLLYDNYWKAVPMSRFENEYIELKSDIIEQNYVQNLIKKAKAACPTVDRVIQPLERKSVLANSFISRLMPGTIIHPHVGHSKDFMRIHLGIVCDPECKITVGDETKTWQEGKLIAFKDGGPYTHSVVHNGTSERIVFSVDIKTKYLEMYMGKNYDTGI